MSPNLLKAGYILTVYNRTRAKTEELFDYGAHVADSPKEAAVNMDVIISMISDDFSLKAVSAGSEGVFEGARTGAVYIDMSTVSPTASADIAERAEKLGIKYLRAPVLGSTAFAAAKELTFLASGPRDAFDQCADIFGSMGKKSFECNLFSLAASCICNLLI